MAQHCIKGKRIRRVCIPKEYDIDKIQIGIPVICDEAKTVGLIKNGDVVLPSGIFGHSVEERHMDILMQISQNLKNADMCQQIGCILLGIPMPLR